MSLPLFDSVASEAAKVAGMLQAADNKRSLLEFTRKGLIQIARARPDRTVSADDAAKYLADNGISVHALGNAAGSLFKTDDFEPAGWFIKSERRHAHSNLLRVWRVK